jgi:hypothetical protein
VAVPLNVRDGNLPAGIAFAGGGCYLCIRVDCKGGKLFNSEFDRCCAAQLVPVMTTCVPLPPMDGGNRYYGRLFAEILAMKLLSIPPP